MLFFLLNQFIIFSYLPQTIRLILTTIIMSLFYWTVNYVSHKYYNDTFWKIINNCLLYIIILDIVISAIYYNIKCKNYIKNIKKDKIIYTFDDKTKKYIKYEKYNLDEIEFATIEDVIINKKK
jgi:hypothetical protein